MINFITVLVDCVCVIVGILTIADFQILKKNLEPIFAMQDKLNTEGIVLFCWLHRKIENCRESRLNATRFDLSRKDQILKHLTHSLFKNYLLK